MDDAEIDRLRKAICRSFNSQPHKKKYWLAVLEMQLAPGGKDMSGRKRPKDLHAADFAKRGGMSSSQHE